MQYYYGNALLVRPGSYLSLADRVVYAACLDSCLPLIASAVGWAVKQTDYSYRLALAPDAASWFVDQFKAWRQFRDASLKAIDTRVWKYVVMADITGFYENIDVQILISDLRQIGAPRDAIDLLSTCLNRWATVPGRGIPQGHSPSDVLGKYYLNAIDQRLSTMGYFHKRYVDDYRIFCRDMSEAKRALVDLACMLRERGLNLQSAKSEVVPAKIAKHRIDGITPTLTGIRKEYMKRIVAALGYDDPYLDLARAESMYANDSAEAPIEVIREAFNNHFGPLAEGEFDKTLFHFLLRRLGKHRDRLAVPACTKLLLQQPQETGEILTYFSETGSLEDVADDVAQYLSSPEAVYPYQCYQVLERYSSEVPRCMLAMLKIARRSAFESAAPFYLRAAARRYVGKHGSPADLERFLGQFPQASGRLERCELILALRKMEKSRRNGYYARWSAGDSLLQEAVRIAKAAR